MPEPTLYGYHILAALAPQAIGDQRKLVELGIFPARYPEAAIQQAVEAHGLPDAAGGVCIAVVDSKWHERKVAVAQVPEVTVVAVDEGPELPTRAVDVDRPQGGQWPPPTAPEPGA